MSYEGKEKADVLNKYFCSITNLVDENKTLPDCDDRGGNVLENIWVREEEIIDIISILDSNKATGPDKISNKMIISIKKRNSQTPMFTFVTKIPVDICIRTRKIIECFVLIDSYLHHVYFHARDYFTKRQSTLPFRGIYVVGIETFICIYGKLLFPKQYVHPFFGEQENNLLSLKQ